jgi:hypothetical protein
MAVDAAAVTPREEYRLPVYAEIQTLMDERMLILPPYAPWRVVVTEADIEGARLGPDHLPASAPDVRFLAHTAPPQEDARDGQHGAAR